MMYNWSFRRRNDILFVKRAMLGSEIPKVNTTETESVLVLYLLSLEVLMRFYENSCCHHSSPFPSSLI